MIELTDEQASVLKQGYPVRMFVPELGGDVVVILAAQRESTESVLQETLDEIRENAALRVAARPSSLTESFVASLPEHQRPTGEHRESPTSPASPHHDSSSAPDGAQHLSEADRIALANRTNIPRVLRKIANRHIAQHYPTTVAVGLEPRLEVRGDAERLDASTRVRKPWLRGPRHRGRRRFDHDRLSHRERC